MTENVVKIRASSLSGYADCPRRGAANMFREIIEAMGYRLRTTTTSIGAPIGSGVHAAASSMLEAKRLTGMLGTQRDAEEQGIMALREGAADGVLWDRETPEMNAAEQQVLRMAAVYRTQVAPDIDPILVEERLEAEVYHGLVLSGQQDVLAREPGRVRDLKTGKKIGNHAPQLGAYSLLARSHAIEDVKEVSIDFVRRASLKKPQPDAEQIRVNIGQAETAAVRVIAHIAADLEAFTSGDPARRMLPGDPWAFLANPSSMLCSDKWCKAFGTEFCREHAPSTPDDE